MAREWQSVSALDQAHPDIDEDHGGADSSLHVSRTWSASRGMVHWQGPVDLVGSFPGHTAWGSRAEGVTLTLTDRFLLVEETRSSGFGLPLGWLSAARGLTGIDPIVLEQGDRIRITWVDGARVRGFMVRIRGGRFGARAGKRANLLRSAALTLELGAASNVVDIMLPPEHDLSLNWDAFAAHEHEAVIWSGRASMPVANGLEQAQCDVWLTTESLIWGASSRAGIYRVATSALSGVVTDEVSGDVPALYLGIGGLHQTQVDLPMLLGRPGTGGTGLGDRLALIEALNQLDIPVHPPAVTPQPWRPGIGLVPAADNARGRTTATTATIIVAPVTAMPAAVDEPAGAIVEPIEAGSAPVPQPALAQGVTTSVASSIARPRSAPLPWGPRVERAEGSTLPAAVSRPARLLDPLRDVPAPSAQKAPTTTGEDGLRIWPPMTSGTRSDGTSSSARPVRRPLFRTTTEEFLASEAASRLQASAGSQGTDTTDRRAERGVLVSFPQSVACHADGLTEPATDGDTAAIVPETSPVVSALVPVSNEVAGELTGIAGRDTTDEELITASSASTTPSMDAAQLAEPRSADLSSATSAASLAPIAEAQPYLARLRPSLLEIDRHLHAAIVGIDQVTGPHHDEGTSTITPHLRLVLDGLTEAVNDGELTAAAAQTHRSAVERAVDTAERLRSLRDLAARGYLNSEELAGRRDALLGRDPRT